MRFQNLSKGIIEHDWLPSLLWSCRPDSWVARRLDYKAGVFLHNQAQYGSIQELFFTCYFIFNSCIWYCCVVLDNERDQNAWLQFCIDSGWLPFIEPSFCCCPLHHGMRRQARGRIHHNIHSSKVGGNSTSKNCSSPQCLPQLVPQVLFCDISLRLWSISIGCHMPLLSWQGRVWLVPGSCADGILIEKRLSVAFLEKRFVRKSFYLCRFVR